MIIHCVLRNRNLLQFFYGPCYFFFVTYLRNVYCVLFRNAGPIYRYDSLRKLVNMRCENIRKMRMREYREKLEAQQPAFLQEKYETLQWIKETEEKLGLEVTVDPEKGIIEPPEVRYPTVWERVFKPLLDK